MNRENLLQGLEVGSIITYVEDKFRREIDISFPSRPPCEKSVLPASRLHDRQIVHADLREILDQLVIDIDGMYSKNEDKDDLTALTMRGLLVPYYRAETRLFREGKRTPAVGATQRGLQAFGGTNDRLRRIIALKECVRDYEMFFERCLQYDVLECSIKSRVRRVHEVLLESEHDELGGARQKIPMDPGAVRQMKIEGFKKEKSLRNAIEGLELDDDMEEGLRIWAMMTVNLAALKASESATMIEEEIKIIQKWLNMSDEEKDKIQEKCIETRVDADVMRQLRAAVQGLSVDSKRSEIGGAVFRPSHILPTLTIEQFGEIEMKQLKERMEREKSEQMTQDKEEEDGSDDERTVYKCRQWDDFKDDNPRGWGNSKLRPTS